MRLTQAQLAHIRSLENSQGQLTAKRLLADARLKKSPLHTLTIWRNWDTTAGAEKWWLHCARTIIGAVTVQVTHESAVVKTPYYVSDMAVKGDGYRSVVSLQGDTVSARESLVYTLEVAAGHLRRAYDLAVPLGLEQDIDALLEQVTGVARVVAKKAAA